MDLMGDNTEEVHETIERRGDLDDLDKSLLQGSFKSSSATSSGQFARQTARLEPKFTEVGEDDNKIQFTRRTNAYGRSHTGSTQTRLRYNPLAKSHSVRLNRFKVRLTSRYEDQTALPSEVEQLNAFDSQVKALDLDDPLLNIDPARITWLPTTFTSLVTLRAGQRKSVIRTLTITTSFPTTIEPSEVLSNGISENGITVIDPTPSLVQSRVYSTEQHTWRTSLVPASQDGLTSMKTITESFVIRKFVTAYSSPPSCMTPHSASNSVNHINICCVLFLTLPGGGLLRGPVGCPAFFGLTSTRTMPTGEMTEEMANETLSSLQETDDSYIKTLLAGNINATATTKVDVSLPSNNILNELQNALQKNPLAALLLGLSSQLQPSLQTVTRSSTYVTTDVLYHTRIVSFYDGRRTRSKRLSDSTGKAERTLTTYTTEVITVQPTQAFPFPFLLQPTPSASYSTVTSMYTTVTTGTSYASKIFTLIYNAFSTRYRTVTSSSTYPTTMVVTSTSSFLVQPTVAYGGYPGAAPGYPAHAQPLPQLQPSQPVGAVQPSAPLQGNAAPQPTPVTNSAVAAALPEAPAVPAVVAGPTTDSAASPGDAQAGASETSPVAQQAPAAVAAKPEAAPLEPAGSAQPAEPAIEPSQTA
ncbi:hypothetical protein BIW11_08443 [Tropilaelaps mercedesae]|uniref:Uncharacterized protein n=1 Tax=Tropilaelaps mercedesae TaxID=418985 RepID=A0A1V9XPF5_9ACAR|nr:hypothetical protein BIW11_08443 [Tropilaelaps mercedesae]